MKKLLLGLLTLTFLFSFYKKPSAPAGQHNKELARFFDRYFEERMQLIPLESTYIGDSAYNDQLYADFTDSYRGRLTGFFSRQLKGLQKFNRAKLGANEKASYDIFRYEMETTLRGLSLGYFGTNIFHPDHRFIPFSQFQGVPLWMGQLGSGEGAQPFKTVKDYDNWVRRARAFAPWADSAIAYFRKGMKAGIMLPEALVKKMIPQMEAMVVADPVQSLFYGPVNKMPQAFSTAERERLTAAMRDLITSYLVPSYRKLGTFLRNEYLPKARKTTGIGTLPAGTQAYRHLAAFSTTTTKTPQEIYTTGLAEVARIRRAMDSVKASVGFSGDLNTFFAHMKEEKKFTPFKTAGEVLDAYRAIQARIEPHLGKMFGTRPRTPFEIRQTEAFRAASASAEYNPGSADGSRPGIFYVPILDPTTYNVTSGMEGLFLHEAIPGHHFQISLQQENGDLPRFRRFAVYGAYAEGWGLYGESLGKELGLYTDPYQYVGALGKEIHRAIRLVVDVGMHHRMMTREEAIRYMMDNMPVNEQRATAEIERYMAMPGQALSYKIGSLKITELRNKYQKAMGSRFRLDSFHDFLLSGGSMPLQILEKRMDAWAAGE